MAGGHWLVRTVAMARLVAQAHRDGHVGGHGHMMSLWGGEVFMWVFLLVVIGVLVYILVQNLHSQRAPDRSDDTSLEILKKQYARGEITKDEYEERRRLL